MALERVPADIRKDGGVARMSDPRKIKEIQQAVTIPVMAKVRIGHFGEAQILESLGVDYIDESEGTLNGSFFLSKKKPKNETDSSFVCFQFLLLLMMRIMSISQISKSRLFVVQEIWAKLYAVLRKELV